MRHIKYIVIHCTATPVTTTVASILAYWKEKLGWKDPGYHYIIERDGNIKKLQEEYLPANGVKGYNTESIHISYIGGIDKTGKPLDNRTPAQQHAMFDKIVELSEKYRSAQILGHRDFPGVVKDCPSFDVREWLRNYEPNLKMAA